MTQNYINAMLSVLLLCSLGQSVDRLENRSGPFEPAVAVKHFHHTNDIRVSLVAAEPKIIDPVALCFDDKKRIYVCEMPGYPNGGRALGDETRGRIKRLEDRDGDGTYETVVTFAEGLRFPTGVMAYKNGVIVCNAPEILFLTDRDGDGKADTRDIWYTGFDLTNIQQLPNSLQVGPDGSIHGMVAGSASVVRCPSKPGMAAVPLRNNGFRFHPDDLSTFQATSGGGQCGLTRDSQGNWFTCTNGHVCRQIVLPQELLRKNPDYIPSAVTADIDVEGTSVPVFRKSPFETWRVERTTRRREGDDPNKYARTELVPGGYTSSTCSCVIVDGIYYACDPGNNLIFRRKLTPNGIVMKSSRMEDDKDREFLASDDNWFRPVAMILGPDGALYVCDFYREIIETPLSIPDDMKKRMNIESRARGRIWKIEFLKARSASKTETPAAIQPTTSADPWVHAKFLCETESPDLLNQLTNANMKWNPTLLQKAATVIGRRQKADEIDRLAAAVAASTRDPVALSGLADGLASKRKTLVEMLSEKTKESLAARFRNAAEVSDVSSVRLLAFAPYDIAGPALAKAIRPEQPVEIRVEAVRSLARQSDAGVTAVWQTAWPTASPDVRKALLEVWTSTPVRASSFLESVEKKIIQPGEVDAVRVQALRNHTNADVKKKANALFGPATSDRAKLIADYATTITTADAAKGKLVFMQHCASCHVLDGQGHDVGPNLLAAVPGRSTKELLTAILDPNREVDARYVNYSIELKDGRILTGIITTETANGLTLRRADGQSDTLPRDQIETIRSTGQSLMPEGLERTIDAKAMGNLLEYLRGERSK